MKRWVILLVVLFSLTGCFKTHVKINNDTIVFSEPETVVQFEIDTLDQELPTTKADGALDVIIEIMIDNTKFKSYGTIRVQGSSTSKWPKKNWSLRLFEDAQRTREIKMQIGDSIASDQWILKAEWIDPSMLRNALSYRLWESMVKSRDIEPIYEVQNALILSQKENTNAIGFPKSYPSVVNINKEHYGTSILLMGHDPNNFNIDFDNENHMYMEFDARGGYTSVKTWEKFRADGVGEWIDGYYPENEDFSENQLLAIEALGAFINSSLEDFIRDFDLYFDKTNIIDMLLLIEVLYDYDAVAQDIEMVTYDLVKWYWLPWDKDTTFGVSWSGSGFLEGSLLKTVIDYNEPKEDQTPWYKTYHAFTNDIEARYKELRDKGVFSVNNIESLAIDISSKYSEEVMRKEYERWLEDERPSIENLDQENLIHWFGERIDFLDGVFNYKS